MMYDIIQLALVRTVSHTKKGKRLVRTLTQDVVEDLLAQIRTGSFPPGEKLPTEIQIMQEFGVSRTVVREAITHLQAAGLVETRHGIGTFILSPPAPNTGFRIDPATIGTLREILAVLEIRISLETEAAGLAALRRTEEQLVAMRKTLDTFQASAGRAVDDTAATDFQFHLQIAGATGNQYFADIMNHLGAVIIPRTRLNTTQFAGADLARYQAQLGHEHEAILAAIRDGDTEAARVAMRLHLSNSSERLRQANEMAQRSMAQGGVGSPP